VSATLIDWHCHLDRAGGVQALDRPDPGLENADEPLVIAVTNRPAHWQRLRQLQDARLLWGLGLHPGERDSPRDLAQLLDLLDKSDAVGEIGLDGTAGKAALISQRTALQRILSHPALRSRVVSIHSRRAVPAILEHLEEHQLPGAVLHWFTGTPAQTARAASTGAWFSVNASMARSAALPEIPHDRLLLETDAPYSRAKTPGQLSGVLAVISSTWRLPVDECAAIVQCNQMALLAATPDTAAALKRIASWPEGTRR